VTRLSFLIIPPSGGEKFEVDFRKYMGNWKHLSYLLAKAG